MEADDPVDTVSGTRGLAGCSDSVLILARSSQGTTLYVRGRDIEEAEHAITFDNVGCRWTILGNAADVHRSDTRRKILACVSSASVPLGPEAIGHQTDIGRANVDKALARMVGDGEIIKISRGLYIHPERTDLFPPTPRQKRQFVSSTSNLTSDTSDRPPEIGDPRCDHCGFPETTNNPVQQCAFGDEGVRLHRNCQNEWQASHVE